MSVTVSFLQCYFYTYGLVLFLLVHQLSINWMMIIYIRVTLTVTATLGNAVDFDLHLGMASYCVVCAVRPHSLCERRWDWNHLDNTIVHAVSVNSF